MAKKHTIGEEELALFVSGELSDTKAKLIQDRIDQDEALAARVAKLHFVDTVLNEQLSEQYPVPDDFRDLVRNRLEASELSFFGKLAKKVGFVSIFSGTLGAGVAVLFMSMFATPVMLTRGIDGNSPAADGEVTFYAESLIWDKGEELLIRAYARRKPQTLIKFSTVGNTVISGDELQIEVLPLIKGEVSIAYISANEVQEIYKSKVKQGQQQLVFDPDKLPKFKSLGSDEIKIFINKKLQITYPVIVSNFN